MEKKAEPTLSEKFPSIDSAYEIAIASYENVTKRIDSTDGRIQTLLTFALAAYIAVPTLLKNDVASFFSWPFITSVALLAVALGFGAYARFVGKIKMLRPKSLWDGWLHLSPAQFKLDMIFFAGEDYEANVKLLEKKWNLGIASLITFALSLVFLMVWATGNPTLRRHSVVTCPQRVAQVQD
jgi:hypothetical protein